MSDATQLAAVTAERDRLRTENATEYLRGREHEQAARANVENAHIASLRAEIARLTRERDELQTRYASAIDDALRKSRMYNEACEKRDELRDENVRLRREVGEHSVNLGHARQLSHELAIVRRERDEARAAALEEAAKCCDAVYETPSFQSVVSRTCAAAIRALLATPAAPAALPIEEAAVDVAQAWMREWHIAPAPDVTRENCVCYVCVMARAIIVLRDTTKKQ